MKFFLPSQSAFVADISFQGTSKDPFISFELLDKNGII